jgi:hypothetical protein
VLGGVLTIAGVTASSLLYLRAHRRAKERAEDRDAVLTAV